MSRIRRKKTGVEILEKTIKRIKNLPIDDLTKELKEYGIQFTSLDSFITKMDWGHIDMPDKTVAVEDKELVEKLKQDKFPNFSIGYVK